MPDSGQFQAQSQRNNAVDIEIPNHAGRHQGHERLAHVEQREKDSALGNRDEAISSWAAEGVVKTR